MKEAAFKNLLEEQISIFLDNIAHELEKTHDRWFDEFGFPIFGETSKDYFEQVYFQSYLEAYIRKLANSILKTSIYWEGSEEYKWPELDFPGIYNGYTNIECERKFGFEFINIDSRIGYRYTHFIPDQIEDLLIQGDVDTIELIMWQSEDTSISVEYADERIKVLHLWDLFQEIFKVLEHDEVRIMYNLFIDSISIAVKQAKSMISLVTLPGFTPLYIHKSRKKTTQALETEVNELQSFYVKNKNYKETEINSQKLVQQYKLPHIFLENGWARAFVGTSQYAKSFMTSEYLYQHFEKNPLFDFTPIVSGYIKSIEQLLHAICINYRNTNGITENLSSFTLGNYIYYINNNEGILRKNLQTEKKLLTDCLESYRVESRNRLFHKDYFNNWDRVVNIRKNTIFLYVSIMGATDPSFITSPILGIVDEKYDQLFYTLDGLESSSFCIILEDKEYNEMRKEPRTTGISFDKNGLIKTPIRFTKYDYTKIVSIEISREKMPSEVWITDLYGRKTKKLL